MPVPHATALSPARRPGRLLIACTSVLLIVGPTAASPAVAADSVSYDFESPSRKLPFMAINGFGRVLVGPAPGGRPGQAARVNIPNDGRSFKSELVIKNLDAGSHRFSFANYLPGDWQERDLDTIVAQWFSTQDDGGGIKPVVALSVHGGDWQLKVHWMSHGEIQEAVIPLGAARLGHWNRWTFDITWSSADRPGSIAVTRDGVAVGSHQGANNYHRGDPPHFRIGVYRPNWRPEKGPSKRIGASEAVLFLDDIAITSTTAEARPDALPTAPGGAASPSESPALSPGPTPTGPPSASSSAPAGEAPVGGATAPGATAQEARTGATAHGSAGRIGVVGGAVGGAAALAGGAFVLLRRRDATGSPRRGRRRSRT
ncbi:MULTISPECIES: heparin lyase I family protein [Streptomyces]|uniref:heparin lyase I family protein n=1 Tax=Streptomyces TaxID=1883 RepID=UPI0013DE37D4|nr:heparin lyase I family protein [Streptomyces sp. ADI91-18]